jgi:hypothetical protein
MGNALKGWLVKRLDHYFVMYSHGRDGEENWASTYPVDIAAWSQAINMVGARTYSHQGVQASVKIDFRPLIRRLKVDQKCTQIIYSDGGEKAKLDAARKLGTPLKVPFSVTLKGRNGLTKYHWYAPFFAESTIYDAFVTMNIAVPGCFNAWRVKFVDRKRRLPSELNLSAFYFDNAWFDTYDGKWPKVTAMPIGQVSTWFARVRRGVNQVPESRMEKVVFALMHICKGNSSPETIIWIFHALETLFDTRAGENFRALLTRIQLLLQPDDKQFATLKKRLRELYDLRSAFVHGGLEVGHPIHSEVIDKRLDEQYGRLLNANLFGFTLLLSSIQNTIGRNWVEPRFNETLTGSAIDEDSEPVGISRSPKR